MRDAARAIQKRARETDPDVILTIADLGVFDTPYVIYQDLSFDIVLREIRAGNDSVMDNFAGLTMRDLEVFADRQRSIFDSAAVVIAMSDWYARSLVDDSGIDPSRVAVVRPGATAKPRSSPLDINLRVNRLLFVGRDFYRKGGDLVVEATRNLRGAGADLSLTIVGPRNRPAQVGDEEWIDYKGDLSPAEVAGLMRSHTAFVLPTRFDAYGIVFHEALLAGTPCVGPRAFAIPEIVTDGQNGALFDDWTVADVVDAISRVVSPEIRTVAFESACSLLPQLTWERAAHEMRSIAARVCSSPL